MHPPNKTLLWELATVGQQHQPQERSDLLQMDAHSHVPQGDPSWSFSSVAPALLRSTDFCGNLARATQVFRAAGVDNGQSGDSPENARTLHDALVLAQRHLSGTPNSRSSLAYRQHLLVLSRRTCQAHLPRTPVHFFHPESILWQNLAAPFAGVCLIFAGVCFLYSLGALWWLLLQPVQHFIRFCQYKDVHCTPNAKIVEPNRGKKY